MVAPMPIPTGVWGGTNVQLNVTSSGATVAFCCALGNIPGPIAVDSSGHFTIVGTYQSTNGPIPVGGFVNVPATYAGTVNGNTMSLTVSGPVNQSYSLTFGVQMTTNCVCAL
jgi:hypothetical protein